MAERYDPEAGVWTRLADMPVGRSLPAAETIGDTIYVLGDNRAMDRYDPAIDAWTRVGNIPRGLFGVSTAIVGDRLYAFGDFFDHDRVYEYSPAGNRWRERRSMPTPRVGGNAVTVGGKIYVVGGSHSRDDVANQVTRRTVEIYDPERDTWRAGPSTENPHDQGAAATVNGVIYAIDGYTLPGPLCNSPAAR